MSVTSNSVLIIGAGAAGLTVAETLRHRAPETSVTILGDEPGPPIDRPPLSKDVLSGAWAPEKARLLSERRLEGLGARLLTGRRARELDMASKAVTTDDGAKHSYDALVIATGVQPRVFPAPDLASVHVLRTLEDSLRLQQDLRPGARLVILGAGFLGLEAAATACAMGVDVTVVESTLTPLASRVGPLCATRLLELHRKAGVRILTGREVESIVGEDPPPPPPYLGSSGEPRRPSAVREVRLVDGTQLEAECVLVSIGCVPQLEWLVGSGIDLDDGIVCDEYCRAAPGVWAAGDIARWLHVGLGRHVRLEHRTNATEQGRAVALDILGVGNPYTPIPFFWTTQHGATIQVAGTIPKDASVDVIEGDANSDSFIAAASIGKEVVGVIAWNAARRMPHYRLELAKRFQY
ncbi:NAD(P)/FAD-dependent oxidoreductase [Dactylosporangium sp. CA-233914]|uniref:NAD(P)/FAD-dependent oxidoreductase n=1 Tax=Dactylosporangium sp. CA-233914 TaxID=3239934 RepID=UPI003D8D9A4E